MTWSDFSHPSDAEVTASEGKAAEEEGAEIGSVAPNLDPVAQLQAELSAAKQEVEEWRDRHLRKSAEFDNYRKRTEKEKIELMMVAKSSVLEELLPVADACERALASIGNASDAHEGLEQYRVGVELLLKQLNDVLTRIGVVPIEAEGMEFNPHLHEAMIREVTSELEENRIIRVIRKGYLFKDRLLRPAQVSVATRPKAPEKSDLQSGDDTEQ